MSAPMSIESNIDAIPAAIDPIPAASPRTRRALLAGVLGGLGAWAAGAVAGVRPAAAAAGQNMILGVANDSGTSQTILKNAGLGAAFTLWSTNVASGATGIFGWSSSTGANATKGVYGQADGPNSYGVYAEQTGATGSGSALFASGGNNDGVVGGTARPDGFGVLGLSVATSGSGTGVGGASDSTTGVGVHGLATATSGSTVGVLGTTDSLVDGWGVFSNGDSGATGVKSFVIDHPLDPANRYLRHYCAEGAEPLNVYTGIATLGSGGTATVQLPDWFGAVNGEVRYQLTAIGAFAPLYISQELGAGNTFAISGGPADLKVSWLISAPRDDPSVRSRSLPVTPWKEASARGTYLHPEAYGKPATARGGLASRRGVQQQVRAVKATR